MLRTFWVLAPHSKHSSRQDVQGVSHSSCKSWFEGAQNESECLPTEENVFVESSSHLSFWEKETPLSALEL